MKIILITVLLLVATAANADEVRLQLKWYHQFQFAGFYAAQLKGFYRDVGLDVTILEGGPDIQSVEDILSGKIQYGVVDGATLIEYHLKGKPVTALAVVFQHSPLIIMTLKNRGIANPSDLLDKRIMAPYDQSRGEIKAVLLNEGLPLERVEFLPRYSVDTLIKGEVDATSAYITDEPYYMRSMGVEPGMIKPVRYGIDFYGDVLFSGRQEVTDHPERVEAFIRASMRGWEYAFNHVEEMTRYIMTLPGVKARGITQGHLLYEAREMEKLILPKLVEMGHMNPGRWKHMADTYVKLGIADSSYSLSDFIYSPKSDYSFFIRLTVAVASLLFTFAMVLFAFNRKLKAMVQKRTAELTAANSELRSEINERTEAQDKLARSQAFLSDAQMIANLGSWDWDGETDRFVWSKEVYNIFGVKSSEFDETYRGFMALIHEADRVTLEKAFADARKLNTPIDLVHRIMHSDGSVRFVHQRARVSTSKGKSNYQLVGTVQDITERRRLEEMMIQTEKMMSIGGLAAGMAHEINNPLAGIMQNVQVIQNRISRDFPKNCDVAVQCGTTIDALDAYMHQRGLSKMLSNISETGKRVSILVSNMLSFSRRSSSIKEDNDLAQLLDQTIELAANDYDLKKQFDFRHIKMNKDYREIAHVPCEASKIQQVLLNLLKNGAEAMASIQNAGHPSTQKQPQFDITLREEKGMAIIKVKDNGPGMPEEVRKRVFEPFYTTKGPGLGTGLGLSVSYYIITEAHNGFMKVDSTVGCGTCFTIGLPFSN